MSKCFILLLVVSFSSCQKLVNFYDVEGKKKLPPCKIISRTDSEGETIYSYNEFNDPVSIERVPPNEWQTDWRYETFLYDDQKRLTQHSVTDYFFEEWNYVYEGSSRQAARDTLWDWADRQYVEYFDYDDLGRIVRIKKEFVKAADHYAWDLWGDPTAENQTTEYFYDIRGNRHSLSSYSNYGDKPSLSSLHPVWQLTARDFSKNSIRFEADVQYNEFGLPTVFSTQTYEYDCD